MLKRVVCVCEGIPLDSVRGRSSKANNWRRGDIHLLHFGASRHGGRGSGCCNRSNSRLQRELLQLGDNVLAVRVLLQRIHMRTNLVQQCLPLGRLRHVNHLLDDIICILIFHHYLKTARRKNKEWLDKHSQAFRSHISLLTCH